MSPTQCAIDDLRDGRLRVVEPIGRVALRAGRGSGAPRPRSPGRPRNADPQEPEG